MIRLRTTRIGLPTGVTLKVGLGGEGEPIIFLHGFPESHRSWRHQLHALMGDFLVIAPDQRGFGGSDKPQQVAEYKSAKMLADLLALADALDLGSFNLVGHDFGGVVAWEAALRHPGRIKRLAIVNAPHPLIFQKSLIEDPAQRAASQYINLLRSPAAETAITAAGTRNFLEKAIGANADLRKLPEAERDHYAQDWEQPGALTAMLNWYRASKVVVPEPGGRARLPLWTRLPFPKVKMPTIVIWGMKDHALLPVQLEGLDDLVGDLRIVRDEQAGHFIIWEKPEVVTGAIRAFIAGAPLE